MRKIGIAAALAISSLICSIPSQAKIAFKAGTVVNIFIAGAGSAAESVTFTMSFGIQTTGCKNNDPTLQMFSINPSNIADAQTRKDLLTLIMASKTSGIPLTVDWDDQGAHCDAVSGLTVPEDIGM